MRHADPRAILLADGVDPDVQDARQSDLPPLDWLRGRLDEIVKLREIAGGVIHDIGVAAAKEPS